MASQQITEEAVYLCTGNPLPKDIEQISYWLLNESFTASFDRILQLILIVNAIVISYASIPTSMMVLYTYLPLGISEVKMRKGLALVDVVREVTM